MPLFLGQFSYSSDAIKALIDSPEDRLQAAKEGVESLGAKLIGIWYAFGEFDGVYLVDAPDNTTAMALPMLLGSSKAFSKVQTTVLMETGEAQQAMRKAADARYRPPA
jgi:uncharacterized protein with GYD domain